MSGRAAPRQQRSIDTVERILEAANRLIADDGLQAVTTTRIAGAAGVSVGALYRFFPDKHAVAEALAQRFLVDAADGFGGAIGDVESLDDFIRALGAVVAFGGELALAHPAYYRITQERLPDEVGSPAYEVRLAMVDMFDGILERIGVYVTEREARRLAVEMVIETVRHNLAIAPREPRRRAAFMEELVAMVTGYARTRLDGEPDR